MQSHGAGLRRELGLLDLVFAQILLVVVPDFFGTAVKAGPAHVVLWLAAMLLFFIPLALIVAHLNRLMPLEGGLYEWARLTFNDQIGFLVAWNLWLFIMLYVAVIGLVTSTFLAYAVPSLGWMADNKWAVLAASVVLIALQMLLASIGFGVSKWFNNAGSIAVLVTIAMLIGLPVVNAWHGAPAFHPLRLVAPPLTVFTLSVFSKMTFGALSGFEYVAIFAGESRNPARNIGRSILITAPVIALIYIFTTSAILAYVSPDAVDVIGPIPQALRRGFGNFRRRDGSGGHLSAAGELSFDLQPLFQRQRAFAHGSGLGPPVARMVLASALPLQNAGELDLFSGRRDSRRQHRRTDWGRRTRGLRTSADLGLHFLRHCVSGAVRDSAARAEGQRDSSARRVAGGGCFGIFGDVAIRGAVDFSDHRCCQFVALFAENRSSRDGRQSSRMDDLPGRSGKARKCRFLAMAKKAIL